MGNQIVVEKQPRGRRRGEVLLIEEAFDNIRASEGKLTPVLVEKKARDKNSPLHKHFTWDDKLGAYKNRLQEARHLINYVSYQLEGLGNVSKYESVIVDIVDNKPIRSYETASDISKNKGYTEQVLRRAMIELKRWQLFYDTYEDFGKVNRAINETEKKLAKKLKVKLDKGKYRW